MKNHGNIRNQLRKWFKNEAPSLSEAYEGALAMLDNPDFPGRVSFISHAVRDITDRLIYVLDPQKEGERVQYESHLDGISDDWPVGSDAINDTNQDVNIEFSVYRKVDDIVQKHKARRKRASNYEMLFDYLMKNEPENAVLNERVIRKFKAIREHFCRKAHFSQKKPSMQEELLQSNFAKFENVLYSFAGSYFISTQEIDSLLKISDPEKVQPDLELIGPYSHEKYFFDNLTNPAWIPYLAKNNFFDGPPEPEEDHQNQVIKIHTWPPSRYLARMAETAPAEVANILSKIKTENTFVLYDINKAALAMPPEIAIKLVDLLAEAIKKQPNWIYLDEAVELCRKVADAGFVDDVIPLFKAIFRPGDDGKVGRMQIRDEYWYKERINKILPALIEKNPTHSLKILCAWLKIFIDNHRYRSSNNKYDDYSYSRRPAIEEHEQNDDYDMAAVMVGIVRHNIEESISSGRIKLDNAFSILAKYRKKYLVYERMYIHLLHEFGDRLPDETKKVILDPENIDKYKIKHEYGRLVGKRFDMLSKEDQEQWFHSAENPTEEQLKHFRGVSSDYDIDNKILKRAKDFWLLEKYHWARDHLTAQRKTTYENLIEQYGEPEMAYWVIKTSRDISQPIKFKSPISKDEMLNMSFKEVIKKISDWKPDENNPDLYGHKYLGLVREFGEYVRSNPVELSKEAMELKGCPAKMVFTFLESIAEAAKNEQVYDFEEVLKLCEWTLQSFKDEKLNENALFSIKWLLRETLKSSINTKLPVDKYKERVWVLVKEILKDEGPTGIDRTQDEDDSRLIDYFELALNSATGISLETLFAYAVWVTRQDKDENGKVKDGMRCIPEVQNAIGKFIEEDRSPEAMAIIGTRIQYLCWLDKSWLKENAAKLFQLKTIEKEPKTPGGWAAWNAFLKWVRPHKDFYEALQPQFAYAVEQAGKVEVKPGFDSNPMNYLGEHLIILYARGQLTLEQDNQLLQRFIKHAHHNIRIHAFDYTGRIIKREKNLKEKTKDRFMKFWELYWDSGDAAKDIEKVKGDPFGDWFDNKQLPAEWRLKQYARYIEHTKRNWHKYYEFGFLHECSDIDIDLAIYALDKVIRQHKGFRIAEKDICYAMEILKKSLKNGGNTKEKALSLIDYMGRQGYDEVGVLLEEKGNEK